jgi:hypothetical protein
MKKLQQICVCALLMALTSMVIYAILLIRAATQTVAAIPVEVRATRVALLSEIQGLHFDLDRQVEAARKDVLSLAGRQADGIREDLATEAEAIRQTADRRIGDTLALANSTLNSWETLPGELKPVLGSAQGALNHLDQTVVDLHPQLLGLVAASKVTAGETAQTMRDVRGAVPGFVAQGQDIAKNFQAATLRFSGVADNLERLTKPKWYDRLIGYGLNGVVIYRNLNPITSLTVTGAQLLSSRP